MFKIEIYFGEDWEKTTGIYAQHYILDRRGATLTTYLSDDMREEGMVFDLIAEDVKLIFVDDEELYNKAEKLHFHLDDPELKEVFIDGEPI